MEFKVTGKENNVKEVEVKVTKEELAPHYEHALEHFKDEVTAPGFRKGKAPKNVVKQKVDKSRLDGSVLNHIYPEIIKEIIEKHKVVPIMNPKIQIKELSEEKGLEATIVFVERPNVKLADYKKIAKNAIKEIEKKEKEEEKKKSEVKIETAKSVNEAKQKAEEGAKESAKKVEEAANKQELTQDQKVLLHTYDKMIEESKIDLAELLVQEETSRMVQNMLTQLARMQINADDYLKQIGKSMTEVREEYKAQAIKNLKLEFILSEISKKEDLKVTEEEIQEVINATPNEEQKKALSTPEQKYYIESTLLKNKVANKLVDLSK